MPKTLKDIKTLRTIDERTRKMEQLRHKNEKNNTPVDTEEMAPRSWVFTKKLEKPKDQSSEKKYLDRYAESQEMIFSGKEPQVETFDEGEKVIAMIELKGMRKEDIQCEIHGDIVEIRACGKISGKDIEYYKEILLPFEIDRQHINQSFVNGIFEIELERKKKGKIFEHKKKRSKRKLESFPGSRILVVDDEAGIRQMLKSLLTKEKFSFFEAASGNKAMELLAKQSIDLVILDILMPGMSGIDVLKEIKEKYPSIVVLMLTGYGTLKTAREALELGAYEYISKPFDIHFMTHIIRKGLTQAKCLEEEVKLDETG